MLILNKSFFPNTVIRVITAFFDLFIGILIIPVLITVLLENNIIYSHFYTMFLYFCIIPYITNGQTLGQFIFRYKTVSLLSPKVTFLQIISRQLTSWFGSNNFGETNENNQQLHDKLFHTTVIKTNKYDDFIALNIKENPTKRYKILTILLSLFIFVFLINHTIYIFGIEL